MELCQDAEERQCRQVGKRHFITEVWHIPALVAAITKQMWSKPGIVLVYSVSLGFLFYILRYSVVSETTLVIRLEL